MKIVSVLLTGILVIAAAGRFNAEADVRAKRAILAETQAQVRGAEDAVARVRLDVEVLESASRLSALNNQHLSLRTVRAEQLVDKRAFAQMVGAEVPALERVVPANTDVIGNAIGMADLRLAARMAEETGESE